jgi:hypothetical protein
MGRVIDEPLAVATISKCSIGYIAERKQVAIGNQLRWRKLPFALPLARKAMLARKTPCMETRTPGCGL